MQPMAGVHGVAKSMVKRKNLDAAVQHWAEPLSAERLFGWHAALFPTGRSGITPIVVGGWRNHPEPMQIVTPRLGRPDVVHFQAPDSCDVPAHMARLIDWFNNPTEANRLDGLVRAALAHLWLEAIHPFEVGNGRIGRALADLAMAQDLRSGQRLFSLSRQMWLDRAGVLPRTAGRHQPARAGRDPLGALVCGLCGTSLPGHSGAGAGRGKGRWGSILRGYRFRQKVKNNSL